jgi:hypothetical protein
MVTESLDSGSISEPNTSFSTAAQKAVRCLQIMNWRSSVARQAIVSREVDPLFETRSLLLGLGEVAIEALL